MKKLISYLIIKKNDDKTLFFLQLTTLGNIVVVLVKLASAFVLPSLWFFVNGCFLTVLCVARLFTIRDYLKIKSATNKEQAEKTGRRNYLNNGIILIFSGAVYFCVSLYMLFRTSRISMHEYMTYLTALIAFWSVGSAIYGMIKYNRDRNPVLKAAKITSFANAMTSIVLTQVVLLNNFSQGAENLNIANGLTGMTVSAAIVFIGVRMIVAVRREQE